jgi:hypothetical protein
MFFSPIPAVETAMLKAEEQYVRGTIGLERVQADWEWRVPPHPYTFELGRVLANASKLKLPSFCEHVPTEMLTTLQAIIDALSAPEFSEISRVLGRFKTAMAELKAVERL